MQYCGIDHKFSWHNTVTPSTIHEKWQVKKYTKLPDISSTIIQFNRGVDVEADLMSKLKNGVFKMRNNKEIDANFNGVFGGGVVTPGKHAQALNVNKFCSATAQHTISLFENDQLKLDCIGVNVHADMINIHVKLHKSQEQPIAFLQGNPHYPTCFRLDLHLNKEEDAKRRKSGTITTTAGLATYIEVELTRWHNEWTKHMGKFVLIFQNEFTAYDGRWTRRCDLGSSHSLHTCLAPVDEDNVDFSSVEQQWESVLRMADGADKRLRLATIITELRSLVLRALPAGHRLKATAPPVVVTYHDNAMQLRRVFLESCDMAQLATTSDIDLINHCRNVANGYRKLVNMGNALAKVLEPVPPVPP